MIFMVLAFVFGGAILKYNGIATADTWEVFLECVLAAITYYLFVLGTHYAKWTAGSMFVANSWKQVQEIVQETNIQAKIGKEGQ